MIRLNHYDTKRTKQHISAANGTKKYEFGWIRGKVMNKTDAGQARIVRLESISHSNRQKGKDDNKGERVKIPESVGKKRRRLEPTGDGGIYPDIAAT